MPAKPVIAQRTPFCGCKQTKKPPFCDGSHSRI